MFYCVILNFDLKRIKLNNFLNNAWIENKKSETFHRALKITTVFTKAYIKWMKVVASGIVGDDSFGKNHKFSNRENRDLADASESAPEHFLCADVASLDAGTLSFRHARAPAASAPQTSGQYLNFKLFWSNILFEWFIQLECLSIPRLFWMCQGECPHLAFVYRCNV